MDTTLMSVRGCRARRQAGITGLIAIGFLVPQLTGAQEPRFAPFYRPLVISSLGNYFSVVGEFHGKLTVFDDFISVKFDSLVATRLLPNDAQRVRLDSIRVGIGVGTPTSWSPIDHSAALAIEQVMRRGDRVVRRDIRFGIKHERRPQDADAWIVVTFHVTVGQPGQAGFTGEGTTYAHSGQAALSGPSAAKR